MLLAAASDVVVVAPSSSPPPSALLQCRDDCARMVIPASHLIFQATQKSNPPYDLPSSRSCNTSVSRLIAVMLPTCVE